MKDKSPDYVSKILGSCSRISEITEMLENKAYDIDSIYGTIPLYYFILECVSMLKNNTTLIREGFNEISNEYTNAVNQHSANMLSLALNFPLPVSKKH